MEDFVRDEIIERTLTRVFMADCEDNPSLFDSKLGGPFPWKGELPEGMLFLGQINFEDIQTASILPSKGLLQFFIGDDDDWGLFSNKFKVVYHENLDGLEAAELSGESPVFKPAKLVFNPVMEAMSYSDYRFTIEDEDVFEDEEFNGSGTKVLGYPAFTQYDPRENHSEREKYDTLLFQVDSDDDYVMWGDVGVANFFINGEALKRGDFSDILYNWDCC